jgi:hypothetical protein
VTHNQASKSSVRPETIIRFSIVTMAAPESKKRKTPHFYLDLTGDLQIPPTDAERVKEELDQVLMNQSLHPKTRYIVEAIQRALPSGLDVPSLQASKIGLQETTKLLGIDFQLGKGYRWMLQDSQKKPSKPLSQWAGSLCL